MKATDQSSTLKYTDCTDKGIWCNPYPPGASVAEEELRYDKYRVWLEEQVTRRGVPFIEQIRALSGTIFVAESPNKISHAHLLESYSAYLHRLVEEQADHQKFIAGPGYYSHARAAIRFLNKKYEHNKRETRRWMADAAMNKIKDPADMIRITRWLVQWEMPEYREP